MSEYIEREKAQDGILRDLGYDPYVMIYDKPHAPKEIRDLQRWCNNKMIFKKTPRFEDYNPHKKA